MPISCKSCPLRKCSYFSPMTDDEVTFMQSFKTAELVAEPGTSLLLEGSTSPQLFTVLSGMGVRYKTLEDGDRQVINFLFPGDLIGLQSAVMGEMKHSVEATTNMVLCVFNRSDIWNMFKIHPERAYDLTWIAAVEEHFLGETIATLGQRNAGERIAWAFLRIHRRLQAVGLGGGDHVPMAFRQQDLADALGLSLVHTNKTIARLRDLGLAEWTDGQLTIKDPDKLAAFAGLEPEPLERRPLM